MVGHEIADELLQNHVSSSKKELFASEKVSLLEESLLTAKNPAIICACSVIRAGCREKHWDLSPSAKPNQIREYIKN